MASLVNVIEERKSVHRARLAAESNERVKKELHRENERKVWSARRKRSFVFIHSQLFEGFCGSVILFNMYLVILDADAEAAGSEPPPWVEPVTHLFLAFYTVELSLKMYVMRFHFFDDTWNRLDFVVVGLDLCFLPVGLVLSNLPSVSILRVGRLLRLARAFKAANYFHELHSLIRSFACAVKAIFWGMIMVIMILIVWGIVAVQLIHPVNERVLRNKPTIYDGCDRCSKAFSSVFDCVVTFWKQLVAGDSWGQLCEPIIEEATWTFGFFILVLVIVNLMLLNLILSVIVEAGAAAAAADEQDTAVVKKKAVERAEEQFADLCRFLDTDGSGSLNREEFVNGFHNNEEFQRCLQVMQVTEADMHMIFNICDEDDSGDVDYEEFVEQIRRIKHSSELMLLYYVTDIRHSVNHHILPPAHRINQSIHRRLSTCTSFSKKTQQSLKGSSHHVEGVSANGGNSSRFADSANSSNRESGDSKFELEKGLFNKEVVKRMHHLNEELCRLLGDITNRSNLLGALPDGTREGEAACVRQVFGSNNTSQGGLVPSCDDWHSANSSFGSQLGHSQPQKTVTL